jgi:SagB-type dehydrogenase family enzyme
MMLLSRPDGVCLYDPGACRSWRIDALEQRDLAQLLSWCVTWRDVDEVERLLTGHAGASREDARATLAELLRDGLLVNDEASTYHYLADRDTAWQQTGWDEALTYHWHTNLLPKVDYAADPHGYEDKAMMTSYLAREPQPKSYKCIAGPRIALERDVPVTSRPIADIFADDVGEARSPGAMTFAELSWLLYLTYGQTATRKLPLTGAHVAKTSPSGGSRHPTEVYPVVFSAEGIAPGLYHYSVEHHALVELAPGSHRRFVQDHVFTHPARPGFPPTVVFLHTTIFERSMFRYREGRSYRVMQYDLGHVMQTGALVASALGRSSYRAYSLHDSEVDRFLGVDGILESVMTFTAVG